MPVAQTRKEFHPLCYEHHHEMMPNQFDLQNTSDPPQTTAYACREPGCLVRYDSPRGYFIVQDGNKIAEEAAPSVTCTHDGSSMYLAEVQPRNTSYRLWRCPQCEASRTNEEGLVARQP
jgi:hypothetical protein